jgi:hypothetical protein
VLLHLGSVFDTADHRPQLTLMSSLERRFGFTGLIPVIPGRLDAVLRLELEVHSCNSSLLF